MDHFEMVEKLRAKANVSYEEAKAALEASDWDILDALVLLESQGKVKGAQGQEYTTQEKKEFTWKADSSQTKSEFRDGLRKLGAWIRSMIHKGNKNQFVITRKGEELIAFPITMLVLLILIPGVGLPTILIALLVGLFLGARYSFRGPDVSSKVTDFMGKAQEKAASAVEAHIEVHVDGKDSKEE